MRLRLKTKTFVTALMSIAVLAVVNTPAHAAFMAYICDDALCTGGGDTIANAIAYQRWPMAFSM